MLAVGLHDAWLHFLPQRMPCLAFRKNEVRSGESEDRSGCIWVRFVGSHFGFCISKPHHDAQGLPDMQDASGFQALQGTSYGLTWAMFPGLEVFKKSTKIVIDSAAAAADDDDDEKLS